MDRIFRLLIIVSVFIVAAFQSCVTTAAEGNLFNQLVETSKAEVAKKSGKLSVALEWPDNEAKPVLNAFKKDFPFIKETRFERHRTVEIMQRTLMETQAGRIPEFDLYHVSVEAWPEYDKAGLFRKPPFPYKDLIKALPKGWAAPDPRAVDPQGDFIATTGLVRGIAYNKNLVSGDKVPQRWEDCLQPMWRGKFLYDPRPKLTALQHDPRTRESHLKWLKGIVDNKVVMGRGQTENVEKLAAGEYPLFCGANYHSTLREADQGAPVGLVIPDPYPMEFGTQMRIVKWTQTPATMQLFALWLATKGEQPAYREFPWKPDSRKYPMVKGKYMAVCEVECLRKAEFYEKEHARIIGLPGAR